MRVPLLAGNWKMFKTVREARVLVEDLLVRVEAVADREVALCPPFTALEAVAQLLGGKRIRLGAQNCYWKSEGAYTGEISPSMLKEIGCTYCIVGHSERRQYFAETDSGVNLKIRALLEFGLRPILCVGESLETREAGRTRPWVLSQVEAALKDLTADQVAGLVIAYEPIWAIGTGKTDTPPEANSTLGMIRDQVADAFGQEAAQKLRLLYGGSVKPNNIDGFMDQPHCDGALVGGASLKAEDFARIVLYQKPAAV